MICSYWVTFIATDDSMVHTRFNSWASSDLQQLEEMHKGVVSDLEVTFDHVAL